MKMIDIDLVAELVEAAIAGNRTELRRLTAAVAKSLETEGMLEQSRRVRKALRQPGAAISASEAPVWTPRDDASRLPLVEEMPLSRRPSIVDTNASRAAKRFVEDVQHGDVLREAGIAVRLGLLLYGKPGTGKTLLAGSLANKLKLPIYTARLDAMISSKLGETSKNIRSAFDFIAARKGILFLDEMDAIAKLRDDKQELGELKRVVNTVLQGLDMLPPEVIVIGATNHPHLLDPAIWRRFPYKIELLPPDAAARAQLWAEFLGEDVLLPSLGTDWLVALSDGLTGAEIEQIALASRRSRIVNGRPGQPWEFARAITAVRAGGGIVIDGHDPSIEDKREVAGLMHEAGRSSTEIGLVLNMTRQMAHRYVKEHNNA